MTTTTTTQFTLDYDDARLLYSLAIVTEDRSPEEQAALLKLAAFLDRLAFAAVAYAGNTDEAVSSWRPE